MSENEKQVNFKQALLILGIILLEIVVPSVLGAQVVPVMFFT